MELLVRRTKFTLQSQIYHFIALTESWSTPKLSNQEMVRSNMYVRSPMKTAVPDESTTRTAL